jgi:hypothetical protein
VSAADGILYAIVFIFSIKSTASTSQTDANQSIFFSLQYLSISEYSFSPNSVLFLYSMYVILPHGVSLITSLCSGGTASSGVLFWNFTASKPAMTAMSISFFAMFMSPL